MRKNKILHQIYGRHKAHRRFSGAKTPLGLYSFCRKNADRLRACSLLALLDTVLYLLAAVVLAYFHLLHISLIIGGVVLCAIGSAVSVCCAALSHLTRKAADMQSENDLTI